MGLADLKTLAEMGAIRRATPKYASPTTIDRARENKAADAKDKRLLSAWAASVKNRDGWKDRMTGKPVLKTIRFVPDRAEAHHLESRQNLDVRYDIRNGLTLSFASHEALEHNEIRVVGTKWFTVKGKRYINCSAPVRFEVVKPRHE